MLFFQFIDVQTEQIQPLISIWRTRRRRVGARSVASIYNERCARCLRQTVSNRCLWFLSDRCHRQLFIRENILSQPGNGNKSDVRHFIVLPASIEAKKTRRFPLLPQNNYQDHEQRRFSPDPVEVIGETDASCSNSIEALKIQIFKNQRFPLCFVMQREKIGFADISLLSARRADVETTLTERRNGLSLLFEFDDLSRKKTSSVRWWLATSTY